MRRPLTYHIEKTRERTPFSEAQWNVYSVRIDDGSKMVTRLFTQSFPQRVAQSIAAIVEDAAATGYNIGHDTGYEEGMAAKATQTDAYDSGFRMGLKNGREQGIEDGIQRERSRLANKDHVFSNREVIDFINGVLRKNRPHTQGRPVHPNHLRSTRLSMEYGAKRAFEIIPEPKEPEAKLKPGAINFVNADYAELEKRILASYEEAAVYGYSPFFAMYRDGRFTTFAPKTPTGFTEWWGGSNPLNTYDFVEVQLRDDTRMKGYAGHVRWSWHGDVRDIMSYKVIRRHDNIVVEPKEPVRAWTGWAGAKAEPALMPCSPSTLVRVKLRAGGDVTAYASQIDWYWGLIREQSGKDVVKYMVLKNG